MPWKATNVSDQRVQFVVLASRRERSLAALCQEFGISRQTGYVWWRRFRENGIAGTEERSRRPKHSPARIASEVVETIVSLRMERPGWGAQKLHHLLKSQHPDLPSVSLSTVHRILVRQGLLAGSDRHRPALQRFERDR